MFVRRLAMTVSVLALTIGLMPGAMAQDDVPVKPVIPPSMRTEPSERKAPAVNYVKIEPEVLDFGETDLGEKFVEKVKVTNISDEPVRVTDIRATCGCTVPEKAPKEILQPGESFEIAIEFQPKKQGYNSSLVRFFVTKFPTEMLGDVQLHVKAMARAPLLISPDSYKVDVKDDFTVTLMSNDGSPFRILAVEPDVTNGLPENESLKHEVVISGEKLRKFEKRSTFIRFFVDHKRTDTIMLKSNKFETSEVMKQVVSWARGSGEVADLGELLAQGADLFETDVYDRSALHHAAQAGELERVEVLLDFQADVDARDKNGSTPLHEAAKSSRSNDQIVGLLIAFGSDIYARDKFGKTPLHWTARSGDAARMQLLIDAGSEVNSYDPNRETVLLAAVKSKKFENVVTIVEAGADVCARDYRGRTAYDQAMLLANILPGAIKEELQRIADYLKAKIEENCD